MEDKFEKLDDSLKLTRKQCLKNIYENKQVIDQILSITGLDIYSKSNSFFNRIKRGLKTSLLEQSITLTDEQFECLMILENNNLFISAPTSFGKTYIAFEYIERNKDKLYTICFVVPTISLLNELRKKCWKYFGDSFVIISSDSELDINFSSKKKILIIVPERINSQKFKKFVNENHIDFLIYDEIYKLHANKKSRDDRLIVMNYVYKFLTERSKKLLLLGPFIKDVSFNRSTFKVIKYITNLNLVYNEFIEDYEYDQFFEKYNDKQFVFFNSPNSVFNFAEKQDIKTLPDVTYDPEIINWMEENIDENWFYCEYLKKGIGIHHGKTPMFLRKYIEDEYSKENGCIHTILCTSTLIEGINTPTNSLVIVDRPRNVFELNNLIGRVGRLNTSNLKKGEIVFTKKEIYDLYNPDEWITLNILFEDNNIITRQIEDEHIYLEKEFNNEKNEKYKNVENILLEKYNITMSEVREYGIEFNILENFLNSYDEIINLQKEEQVLNKLGADIIKNRTYFRGLQYKLYSFYKKEDKKYLNINPVFLMLCTTKNFREIIVDFTSLYQDYNMRDLNIFIDSLFVVEEYIKFSLSKIISVFELFDSKNIFDKKKNRAFIHMINIIKAYNSKSEGYERILNDLGFPDVDIDILVPELLNLGDVSGTENKLKLLKQNEVFKKVSPFGKIIINKL